MDQQVPRYFHRDLSWLLFNRRVIQEADDQRNPLLEQLRFLAIASNNLDEFYMVRVPRIQSLARLDPEKIETKSGLTQIELLQTIRRRNQANLELQYQRYQELIEQLRRKSYYLKNFSELSEREHKQVAKYFAEILLPTLAPIGVDTYHAFPRLLEKALHFWVELVDHDGQQHTAILPISLRLPRLFQLSARRFILVEEIIAAFLEELFVGLKVENALLFRITYDQDLAFQEDTAEDLYDQMEEYLAERKKGLASRLEISELAHTKNSAPPQLLRELALAPQDVYQFQGPLDLTFLFQWISQLEKKLPQLTYPPLKPLFETKWHKQQILKTLQHEDLLVQHPYDSFEVVLAFIQAAVADPTTIAIKQTVYRLSQHSKIVRLLKQAAEKGIQVTVLVEIKARFDEAHNLRWVKELEDAGCFVTYGFPNMKTHSKALLVVQKDGDQLRRYAQIGTGNYNEKNSQIYTDLSFFTSREEFVSDLTDFFNYLSGYRNRPNYQIIATSPNRLQNLLLTKIDAVINYHKKTGQGQIFAKMNALTDTPLIDRLYAASQVGVKIFLQVRGACCLVPGVVGLSENITVSSIVGRFLEHSRIYHFTTEAGPEWWISSADWMTRNMLFRVEIAAPLQHTDVKDTLAFIADVYQADEAKAYFLDAKENYQRKTPNNGISAQAIFLQETLRKTQNLETRRQRLIQQLKQLP